MKATPKSNFPPLPQETAEGPRPSDAVPALAADDFIKSRICTIRGVQVMLDRDLAALYGVETRVLNQAVKRNAARFPANFMFQLSAEEADVFRSRLVPLDVSSPRSQFVTLKRGRGGWPVFDDCNRLQSIAFEKDAPHGRGADGAAPSPAPPAAQPSPRGFFGGGEKFCCGEGRGAGRMRGKTREGRRKRRAPCNFSPRGV